MSFEQWWSMQEELDRSQANEAFARPVWEAAWAQQQKTVDMLNSNIRSIYMEGWHAGWTDAGGEA